MNNDSFYLVFLCFWYAPGGQCYMDLDGWGSDLGVIWMDLGWPEQKP